MIQGKQFINGQWRDGQGTDWIKTDPVSNQALWTAHEANSVDVEEATLAARGAFPAWAKRPIEQRIETIERFAALLEQNKKHLAEVISQETSKPLWETLTEVQSMIGKVDLS